MKVLRVSSLMVAAFALLGASPQSRYQEGQIWEYQTRPIDVGSLLRIQKIEHLDIADRDETIYHLSVIGLHLAGAADANGVLQHIPVSQAALDASVTRLASNRPEFPDASAGIAEWRQAHGGVFTISVAKIVTVLETTVPGSQPQQPVS